MFLKTLQIGRLDKKHKKTYLDYILQMTAMSELQIILLLLSNFWFEYYNKLTINNEWIYWTKHFDLIFLLYGVLICSGQNFTLSHKHYKLVILMYNTPSVPFCFFTLSFFILGERNLNFIFEVYIEDKIYSCGILLDSSWFKEF